MHTLQHAEQVDGAADVSRLVAEVSGTVEIVERRLLKLVKEGAQGILLLQDLTSEFEALSTDLERCYKLIADAADRRDLGFRTLTDLDDLARRCLWLYRKVHLEHTFYTKLDLEAKLRLLISPEGYALYQEILCVEDSERGFLAQTDAELRRRLLGTS
jgi:hypothetical protein